MPETASLRNMRKRAKRLFFSVSIYHFVRIAVGALFVWAGALKLADPRAFAEIISRYGLVPDNLLIVTAIGLPLLEIAAGLGAVFDRRGAIPLLFSLLLLFIVVLHFGILSGLEIDCGCFSLSEQQERSDLRIALVRDWILLGGVLYLWVRRRFFGRRPA